MNNKQKKALVLISGGIDSAVSLWWSKQNNWKLSTLSFLFPGRRAQELRSARKLRALASCKENYEVNLPFVRSPRSDSACHIPRRNLMFYGIAACIAEKAGADFVVGGHIRHDGKVFPDASKEYLDRMDSLVRAEQKFQRPVRLLFPFIQRSKAEIIAAGALLKVPFKQTWSCSLHRKKHCWKCNSCRERMSGFKAAGVTDPLCTDHGNQR